MNLKIMEAKNVDCWIDLDIFHTAKYLDEIFSSLVPTLYTKRKIRKLTNVNKD